VVLNKGRHLYLAGRPLRWALAHILVVVICIYQVLVLRGDRDSDSVVQRRLEQVVSHIACLHAAAMHLHELQCCVYIHQMHPFRRLAQSRLLQHNAQQQLALFVASHNEARKT